MTTSWRSGWPTPGRHTGERVWRLPLDPAYDKMIRSKIADVKNIGGANSGSITAAQFLKRFIEKGTVWAHLDIAGVAWQDGEQKPMIPSWGTGWGVKLLDRLVSRALRRMRCRSAVLVALLSLDGHGGSARQRCSIRPIASFFRRRRAKLLLAPSCAPLPAQLLEPFPDAWTLETRCSMPSKTDCRPRSRPRSRKRTGSGRNPRRFCGNPETIANHARQYAGLMIENRKRILLIAAPIRYVDSDGPHTDPEVQNVRMAGYGRPLGVCDGDPSQFSAQYDPATGSSTDFNFGGAKAGNRAP